MDKCYWAYEDGQKFWIPGCHLALYQDCGPCHCREWEKEQVKLRPPSEEKEYKKMNRHLLEENERLIKVIDELKKRKAMICDCGSLKTERNGRCASCNRAERKFASARIPDDPEPIKKQSDEMKRMMSVYVRKKAKWIKGKKCAVIPHLPAVDVHHSAGRGIHSYYDEWAQERGICLLLDERLWIPVSREGHTEMEMRPAWAKKMGFSEDRLVPTKMRSE